MEVVVVAYPAPTHHVAHKNWPLTAEIVIPNSILGSLRSSNAQVRGGAEQFVAVRFRKQCETDYKTRLRYVDYDDLNITPLDGRDPNMPGLGMRQGGEPKDCDECASCEQDYHERCRSGCPLAY